MVECIYADGGINSSICDSQRGKARTSWMPPDALRLNWYFGAGQKGGTTNELGFEWMLQVFDPINQQKLPDDSTCDCSFVPVVIVAFLQNLLLIASNTISVFLYCHFIHHICYKLWMSAFSVH